MSGTGPPGDEEPLEHPSGDGELPHEVVDDTTDEGESPPPSERRAARRARVRRRRRIVAIVGGSLFVLVLAFALWYELESHALGPRGKQVVVTVREGESFDSVISSLSQQGVIGTSLKVWFWCSA